MLTRFMILVLLPAQTLTFSQDMARIQKLRKEALSALDREMAREKAGDCNDAKTTAAINTCLSRENETSSANYKAFSDALRALLTPPEQQEFDHAQTAWSSYQHSLCSAAFDLYERGTIAPSMQGTCNLKLLRSHMRDLAAVYHGTLHY